MLFVSSSEIKDLDRFNTLLAGGDDSRIYDAIAELSFDEISNMGVSWGGRTLLLLSIVLPALTYLRDRGDIQLDLIVLQESFSLERLVQLAYFSKLPDCISKKIIDYLNELPKYCVDDAIRGQFSIIAIEVHNYSIMSLMNWKVMNWKAGTREELADCIP